MRYTVQADGGRFSFYIYAMRQLVAILFADMVGYTALMQENEQLGRQKRQRLREVLEGTITRYDGRILQYYGDGCLSIFNSAIQAVHCGVSMQSQWQQLPAVDVRIGIHTGDVTIEDGAVYGDGVNVASRVESLAVPGSVFISEKVFDEVRNQEDIRVREMGYFEFKNVKTPIRVYAVAADGIALPAREALQGKTQKPVNRLAVLPFVNMSADTDNEYFSDGITEELLNTLTKIEGLQVTSRTSAFAFKGKHADIRDIGIQLNVDKVLEGSVRKAGNRVRVTAQLINAADGYHLWSETYDRHLTDIFGVQDEISAIIANKLRENLAGPRGALKTQAYNVDAYTLYLKGLHYKNKVTPDDMRTAIQYFEQAIAVEPSYAEAYAATATTYTQLGAMGQVSPQKAFEIAHRYADKALQLDATVAEGHIAKAGCYLFYEWKWREAYDALQAAFELNPGAVAAHHMLATYFIIKGEIDQAVTVMEGAVQLDPLSPTANQQLGNTYIFAERFDDAVRQAEKVLEMHPQMRIALELKAWAIGMAGDWREALKIFNEVHRLTNHPLKGLMGVGFAMGRLGDLEGAYGAVARLEQRQREEPEAVLDADLAAVWFSIGNLDKVFYHIDQCIAKRAAPVSYFLRYPAFKALQKDARFERLKAMAND